MSYKTATSADLRGAAELILGPFRERVAEELVALRKELEALTVIVGQTRQSIDYLVTETRGLRSADGGLSVRIDKVTGDLASGIDSLEDKIRLEREARYLGVTAMASQQAHQAKAADKKIKAVLVEMAKLENAL